MWVCVDQWLRGSIWEIEYIDLIFVFCDQILHASPFLQQLFMPVEFVTKIRCISSSNHCSGQWYCTSSFYQLSFEAIFQCVRL